jgi:hypothetical protein
MNRPRLSVFRDALQVSPERIAAMDDHDLNLLMRRLLLAHAHRCGSPLNEVRVNTEGKAKDDGSDGWSARPTTPDGWLGLADTCWQFKAGAAGEPARLAAEVSKRIPKETLTRGGRFVVITSGSTNGKKGEDDRLAALEMEASAASVPTASIEVIGSERLTTWCNQHPAVAAYWAGRSDGLWTLDDWSSSDEHQVPWKASPEVQSEIETLRADLDFATGSVVHLHIQGPPGVGKTRFALELCRAAAWCGDVIYIRQATDLRLAELIDGAAAETDVQLVVVADEVQADQLRPLRDSVGRGNGRVRLITVGYSQTPDPNRIPALSVKPLDGQAMGEVVKAWHPAMPPEHVEFVVRFADGYVRLARLAANAVAHSPTMDVRGLLNREEIRGFLDGMLGAGDRRPLYVVAVLASVGWTDDKQCEGETVARQFGLEFNLVRAAVEDFHRRFGIVPRSGRYRYISPTPLGIHLAVEAWTTYPDVLKSLPDLLPSEAAADAYYERLQSMASNPQAREYARQELAFFFRIDDFVEGRTVRRWSALSSADPDQAARNIRKALTMASVADRMRIDDDARRQAVWTLVRLAWKQSSFRDAVLALALLAEAENETWANNATAEFIARFQVFLGGTAVPYLDRLPILDEILAEMRPSLAGLAVKALTQVGNRHSSRMGSDPPSDEVPEREWRPKTAVEHLACVEAAVNMLNDIARRGISEIQADLVAATKGLSMMLRESPVRDLIAGFFDTVRGAYPQAREQLRRVIIEIIEGERQYWKQLSAEELNELEMLHARFEEHTLDARLQQHVGKALWDQEASPDQRSLAEELLATGGALAEHWAWLTSGEAHGAWWLGEALAAADSKGNLAEELPLLPGAGPDLRLICGYLSARRRALGDQWYEQWVAGEMRRDPMPLTLVFEVLWRCGATEPLATMLVVVLRRESVSPQLIAKLGLGLWGDNLTPTVLETVLRTMVDRGGSQTAVTILAHRISSKPVEIEQWKPLALQLATHPDLIRDYHMTSYYWKEVANIVVADNPGEIAAAIFREQANRESGTWFAEFSKAAGVLQACVAQDPSSVWRAVKPYLSPPKAYSFVIGFPHGLLDRMSPDEVGSWISENPNERASIVSRLTSMDMSTDETLASRLLGEHGDNERVASAFFSAYVSGTWCGPVSSHWDQLAEALQTVASRTRLPKLRRWASDSAHSLRMMADRDRQREEEEELRGR